MTDTLISRLANCRAMASERLPAADVATIDEAIRHLSAAAPAQVPQPLGVESIRDLIDSAGLDWHNGWTVGDEAENRYLNLCRAVELHHGITGDKP